MNTDVLKYIVENLPDLIEIKLRDTSFDHAATIGVARVIIHNDGDISLLSDKQKFHYESFIKPLLEEVQCEGVFGKNTCTGNGFVDDESLLISYQEDEFLCQHCRYDREKIEQE
jgi:hypothetical protein